MEGHSNLTQRRMRKPEFLGKLLLTYTASIDFGWEWGKRGEEGGGVDCNVIIK